MRLIALTLVALTVGQVAVARCPDSRDDAGLGILVTFDYGAQSVITRSPEGILREVQTVAGDTTVTEIETAHGIFPLVLTNRRSLEPDAFVNGYAVTWPDGGLPEPVEGLVWQSDAQRAFHDSPDDLAALTFAVEAGATGEVVVGDCRYETIAVTTLMDESDATFVTEQILDYIPVLGIAMIRQNRTMGRDDPAEAEWSDWMPRLSMSVME